jgi:hypothetical protein
MTSQSPGKRARLPRAKAVRASYTGQGHGVERRAGQVDAVPRMWAQPGLEDPKALEVLEGRADHPGRPHQHPRALVMRGATHAGWRDWGFEGGRSISVIREWCINSDATR